MSFEGDIPVVYSNGVFRPQEPVSLPENSRLRIAIVQVESASEQEKEMAFQKALERLRKGGLMQMDGWRPTRDELHERH